MNLKIGPLYQMVRLKSVAEAARKLLVFGKVVASYERWSHMKVWLWLYFQSSFPFSLLSLVIKQLTESEDFPLFFPIKEGVHSSLALLQHQ